MQLAIEPRHSASPAFVSPRTAPFDPVVADRLLDLLSTDDDYRALFQRDPGRALSQIGHELGADEECFFGIELASKEDIRQARSEARRMLLQGLAQNAPKLDADIQADTALR